jgi:hypothetical protein
MKERQLFPEGPILLTIRRDRLPDILKNLAEMEWAPESFKLALGRAQEENTENTRRDKSGISIQEDYYGSKSARLFRPR